jgi:hypothetical protein
MSWKIEQPEYTKTPVGLARQSETPEAKLRRLKREPHGKRSVFRLRVIATNFTKTVYF